VKLKAYKVSPNEEHLLKFEYLVSHTRHGELSSVSSKLIEN